MVYRIGPLVWLFTAAAVASVVGGLLVVVGWARGELSGSPWAALVGVLLMAAGFGAVAFRCASRGEPRREPPDAPSDTMLEVRHPLGLVFWLFAALAAVVLALMASGVAGFVRRAIQHGGLDRSDTTGLAAVGVTVVAAMALVGMVSMAVAIPARIIGSYGRTHLWLSREGIGYATTSDDDPGFRPWDSVTAVSYSSRDARGVVYSHVWTIRTSNPRLHISVVYPAGAVPRPRTIRQAIRDVAPAVQVS